MSCEVEINGDTYVPKPELYICSCEGCVANKNQSLCSDISDEGGCNHTDGIIWVKKEKSMETTEQTEEPTYTVGEVIEAVEEVMDEYFTVYQKKQIIGILTRKNNPEYLLYLELKAKFEE